MDICNKVVCLTRYTTYESRYMTGRKNSFERIRKSKYIHAIDLVIQFVCNDMEDIRIRETVGKKVDHAF